MYFILWLTCLTHISVYKSTEKGWIKNITSVSSKENVHKMEKINTFSIRGRTIPNPPPPNGNHFHIPFSKSTLKRAYNGVFGPKNTFFLVKKA